MKSKLKLTADYTDDADFTDFCVLYFVIFRKAVVWDWYDSIE